jgi:hypothetical protein
MALLEFYFLIFYTSYYNIYIVYSKNAFDWLKWGLKISAIEQQQKSAGIYTMAT